MSIGINPNIGMASTSIGDSVASGSFKGHTISKGGEGVVSPLDQNLEISGDLPAKSLKERQVSVVHPQV